MESFNHRALSDDSSGKFHKHSCGYHLYMYQMKFLGDSKGEYELRFFTSARKNILSLQLSNTIED